MWAECKNGQKRCRLALRMGAHMKKKILPVIIAVLLILVIGGVTLGKVLLDKYSYSKEEADWNEFYQVSETDRSAIILQDEMVEEQALIRDGVCYFDLATVHKYMNEVFYADVTENLLKIYSGQISFEDGMAAMQEALKKAAEDD